MEITFQSTARAKGQKSRGKGKVVYDLHNRAPIVFNGGIFRTTKKDEVQLLLHSRLYKDNTIELVTDPELVNAYLEGNEPDKLTVELLQQVDDEGLRKMAKVIGIPEKKHKNYGGVLRSMLKGEPVTNIIYEILEAHKKEAPELNLLELAQEQELIYRSGPWYKFRKGEEKVTDQDLSLGRTEAEAQEWIAKNKQKLKDRLE